MTRKMSLHSSPEAVTPETNEDLHRRRAVALGAAWRAMRRASVLDEAGSLSGL